MHKLSRASQTCPRGRNRPLVFCFFVLRCFRPLHITYTMGPQRDQERTQTGSISGPTHGSLVLPARCSHTGQVTLRAGFRRGVVSVLKGWLLVLLSPFQGGGKKTIVAIVTTEPRLPRWDPVVGALSSGGVAQFWCLLYM